jgi:hypothetical protein
MVHANDVNGYVENLRLKFYLNRWRSRMGDPTLEPTTEQIYEIMLEADREETADMRKPFHVERMAESIIRNGIQEPIVVYSTGDGHAELWDGNRRFFGTSHIMHAPKMAQHRTHAQWIPAFVVEPTGSAEKDRQLQHSILTELNFVEKDHIPWPAYIKAEQIYMKYQKLMAPDPTDPTLSRTVKDQLAQEYGLKGWRVADRWIKMYDLSMQFKEYNEEGHQRDSVDVDLKIQERFEYFDELSKPGVWGALQSNPDHRDEVFDWLWDDKFKSFADVRVVPRILQDPEAYQHAKAADSDGVKRAIETVIANDPVRMKDKTTANARIKHFSEWIDSFRREDYKQLSPESLESLRSILTDVIAILEGLQGKSSNEAVGHVM